MGTCDSNYRKKFEQVKVCSIILDNEFDKNGTQKEIQKVIQQIFMI